jgi:hypothetical protein
MQRDQEVDHYLHCQNCFFSSGRGGYLRRQRVTGQSQRDSSKESRLGLANGGVSPVCPLSWTESVLESPNRPLRILPCKGLFFCCASLVSHLDSENRRFFRFFFRIFRPLPLLVGANSVKDHFMNVH